ncbi:hypothetical protein EVAR_7311_1 [Eumeta japonica]|uniref:Uncharacterized protein n=1 Tax=Eumeta variegata TaxID=151549 RepID=A0A4C1T2J8_EUMVA|nr:hypothetical protein EVAR_7311_1 [Eumeta japonica]
MSEAAKLTNSLPTLVIAFRFGFFMSPMDTGFASRFPRFTVSSHFNQRWPGTLTRSSARLARGRLMLRHPVRGRYQLNNTLYITENEFAHTLHAYY